MNGSETPTIQLRPELDAQVTALATALDRPKAWVVEQAIAEFLTLQYWHLEAIDAGIAAADAGRVVPHDQVVAWLQSWGSPDERPMPECG